MRYLLPSVLILAGCASPAVHPPENGVAAAGARARYRAIQEAQQPSPPAEFEVLPLVRVERTEDGVIRAPSIDHVRVPLYP